MSTSRYTLLESAMSLPSALGTKEHWDAVYTTDLDRYAELGTPRLDSLDDGAPSEEEDERLEGDGKEDAGQLWYGADVAAKHAALMLPLCRAPGARVVDVGTGNGELLCRLAAALTQACGGCGGDAIESNGGPGPSPSRSRSRSLLGTDYVADACALGRRVAAVHAAVEGAGWSSTLTVDFVVDDIFNSALAAGTFDVVSDKATIDAISLSEGATAETVRAYLAALARLARPGGALCLTSANFTRDELAAAMDDVGWEFTDSVKDYATFEYGGVVGTHVRTLLYTKRMEGESGAC